MITVHVHTDERGHQDDLSVDNISDVLGEGGTLLWVDVVDPSADEFRLIGEEFAFHHLALEDAAKQHQRPKIEVYDDFVFIVFYGLELDQARRPQTREIALFIGSNYLVTVHGGILAVVTDTAERWREHEAWQDSRSVGMLVYSVLDAIVDDYFPVVDAISEQIEDIEAGIFERFDRGVQRDIFALRKDLVGVRRVLAHERDVMAVLLRRDSPVFGNGMSVYYQDVYDHILRVTDAVDSSRELLASALDAFLSMSSNRLNEIVKRLTASSIILMSVTLIAGIYGMNFDHMPELAWRFGYAWALGLMAAVGSGLYLMFKRSDWF